MKFKHIFLILSLIFIGMQQKSYAVELVVNVENPVESLSLDKVRYIFLMRVRNWENGGKIKVYVNDWDSEIHQQRRLRNRLGYPVLQVGEESRT
jgi:hypothetical protein